MRVVADASHLRSGGATPPAAVPRPPGPGRLLDRGAGQSHPRNRPRTARPGRCRPRGSGEVLRPAARLGGLRALRHDRHDQGRVQEQGEHRVRPRRGAAGLREADRPHHQDRPAPAARGQARPARRLAPGQPRRSRRLRHGGRGVVDEEPRRPGRPLRPGRLRPARRRRQRAQRPLPHRRRARRRPARPGRGHLGRGHRADRGGEQGLRRQVRPAQRRGLPGARRHPRRREGHGRHALGARRREAELHRLLLRHPHRLGVRRGVPRQRPRPRPRRRRRPHPERRGLAGRPGRRFPEGVHRVLDLVRRPQGLRPRHRPRQGQHRVPRPHAAAHPAPRRRLRPQAVLHRRHHRSHPGHVLAGVLDRVERRPHRAEEQPRQHPAAPRGRLLRPRRPGRLLLHHGRVHRDQVR